MGYDYTMAAAKKTEEPSFLESAFGLTAGTLIAATKDIGDSIGTIAGSIGITSPYEASDTRAVIADYAGEGAAQFYDRNPQLVEGAGLMLGTVVPGGIGIKALRVAQAAKGSVLGSMLNLPQASLAASRTAAADAMVTGDAIYGQLTTNTAKALAAGAGANILDMAAFEVAAMTVTFASPVYSDFTEGDYAKSLVTNVLFGGALGTAFSAAKTSYGVATAQRTADRMTAPMRVLPGVGASEQLPWVNLKGLFSALDDAEVIRQAKALGASEELISFTSANRTAAIKSEIVTEVGRLTPDNDAAIAFTRMLHGTTIDGAAIDTIGTVGLLKELRRGVLKDTTEAGRTFDTVTGTAYDAGVTPTIHIGDSFAPGHEVRIQNGSLLVIPPKGELQVFKIGADFKQLDETAAQAAWLRAAQETKIDMQVAAGDLPRFEKLLGLSDEVLAKQPAVVGNKVLRTHRDIELALLDEKFLQAEALSTKLLPEQIATRLNVKPEFLKEANFRSMIAKEGEELSNFLRAPRHVSAIYDLPAVTDASSHFFSKVAAGEAGVVTTISANTFIREAAGVLKPGVADKIAANLEKGKKVDTATLTVKADGALVFDGNKRMNAVARLLQQADATTDAVPLRVIVEKDAVLPTHLPTGAPFPVIRNAAGEVVPNPKAVELDVRLTKQFAQESMLIENMNKLHSLERSNAAAGAIESAYSGGAAELAAFPPEQLGLSLMGTSSIADKGQKFFTNTEAATGGLAAFTQQVGALTNRLIKSVHTATDNILNPVLIEPMQDAEFKAAASLIMLKNELAGTEANYVMFRDGVKQGIMREDVAINLKLAAEKKQLQAEWDAASTSGALTPAQVKDFKQRMRVASRVIPAVDATAKEFIPLTDEVHRIMAASTELNTKRLATSSAVHAGTGHQTLTQAQQHGLERVYMHPTNTKKYPNFVFVRQADGITSTSHTNVITAATPEALATKVKLLQKEYPGMEFVGNPKSNYEFLYKKDIEAFHKAKGDYEYARGMNENAVDSALRSKKMMWEENPPIDAQHAKEFFNDFLDWHRRMDEKAVRDTVELKYAQLFRQLEVMGSSFAKTGTSTFTGKTASAAAFASQTVNNPYGDMIKQALDIGKQLEYPTWMAANEFMNKGWAKASLQVRKMGLAVLEAKTPRDLDAEVKRLNDAADAMGFGNPYQKAMLEKYREMLPLNPTLTGHIAKGNAALNFLVLGSDMLQAMNTLIGVTVHATEFQALRTSILKQNATGAGKLAGLAAEDVIGGTEALAKATARYFNGGEVWNVAKGAWEHQTGKQMMQGYIRNGLRVGDAQALADAMDNMAYNPSLKADAFGAKVEAGMEAIRKYTGNTPADAISRFMAADSMRQLTDKALSKGLLGSEAEAAIYINQHVTRVHGATIASQRPIMFSGPVGQSIGVFMTFYTNFLQRMFQHAGAGDAKALMTMSAMQVGLYGLQGLPAFNFINTHLIGTASGNKAHADIYGAVGGSDDARWIMYGAGSNLLGLIHPDLRVNLYSRGDLNPRQASIIPVNPADTALFSAISKTANNLIQLATHISGGAGIAPSLAFALEHNGVNRPISGLGAILGGGMTTGKGSLMVQYDPDFLSFSTAARLAGGKPLDDATAADGLYRMQAYKADRAARIAAVGENMRVALKNNGTPDVTGFMRDYVHAGGDTDNFNKFMKQQFATANNSQINKAASDLGTPEAEGLSRLMGGEFMADALHPGAAQ